MEELSTKSLYRTSPGTYRAARYVSYALWVLMMACAVAGVSYGVKQKNVNHELAYTLKTERDNARELRLELSSLQLESSADAIANEILKGGVSDTPSQQLYNTGASTVPIAPPIVPTGNAEADALAEENQRLVLELAQRERSLELSIGEIDNLRKRINDLIAENNRLAFNLANQPQQSPPAGSDPATPQPETPALPLAQAWDKLLADPASADAQQQAARALAQLDHPTRLLWAASVGDNALSATRATLVNLLRSARPDGLDAWLLERVQKQPDQWLHSELTEPLLWAAQGGSDDASNSLLSELAATKNASMTTRREACMELGRRGDERATAHMLTLLADCPAGSDERRSLLSLPRWTRRAEHLAVVFAVIEDAAATDDDLKECARTLRSTAELALPQVERQLNAPAAALLPEGRAEWLRALQSELKTELERRTASNGTSDRTSDRNEAGRNQAAR